MWTFSLSVDGEAVLINFEDDDASIPVHLQALKIYVPLICSHWIE